MNPFSSLLRCIVRAPRGAALFALLSAAPTVVLAQADGAAPADNVARGELERPGGSLISPENRLQDPARDPVWRELFEQLAPNRTRQSSFEERRYFPFRRTPVILRGEIRIVPGRGLSLRYLEPEPHVMIVDAEGVLIRGADGRERAGPTDARAQAASSALVKILRFDMAALQEDFAVYGRRDGASWFLAFSPQDATLANLIGTVLVTGEAAAVSTIDMIKSPTQRIEISIRETREGLLFTGDTLRRFFR